MTRTRITHIAALALALALSLPLGSAAVAEGTEDSQLEALGSPAVIMKYNVAAVEGVGTQKSTGHTSCCMAFCEAYGDSMLYGETMDHTEHSYYGNRLYNPCADWDGWRNTAYDATYAVYEVMEGRPCLMHVVGNGSTWSSSEHWVLVIGYCDLDDPVDATINNLIVLDPWDGSIMRATDRYVRHSDYELRLSSRGISVPQGTGVHSYEQGFCVDCGAKWGDLNKNGTVNIVDAQIAYDVACGVYNSSKSYKTLYDLADVTGIAGEPDGTVDAQDAWAIQASILN